MLLVLVLKLPGPAAQNGLWFCFCTFGQDRVGITSWAVWVLDTSSWNVLNQFTVNFRFWISTCRIAADYCITGQVQDGWEQTCSKALTVSFLQHRGNYEHIEVTSKQLNPHVSDWLWLLLEWMNERVNERFSQSAAPQTHLEILQVISQVSHCLKSHDNRWKLL